MTSNPDPFPDIPSEMPIELKRQKAAELMRTIENFCKESELEPIEIVGALEGVKFSLLKNWFQEDERE